MANFFIGVLSTISLEAIIIVICAVVSIRKDKKK